jgi:iron complex outermembrane receptor protein
MTFAIDVGPRRRALRTVVFWMAAAGLLPGLGAAADAAAGAAARGAARTDGVVERASSLHDPADAARESAEAASAVTVTGTVRDADGKPLAGARVSLGGRETTSDSQGRWSLAVGPGVQVLLVTLDDFAPVRRDLRIAAGMGAVEVRLVRPPRLREHVVVQGVRADERTPVTKTDVDRADLEAVNRGQEMPFLLGSTPGVNFQSDTGLAAGYSYFNVRGIGQTRLNITLDGVPLQDPEDQALYFADFGDFASVVDSVQIQRGIGTSSYGSASYGGSVNFASVNPAEHPCLEAQAGAGSWGTGRGTVAVDSGRIGGGVALYGRYSAETTDGFRDHSGVDQHTAYFGATRQDERSFLKLFGLVGRERTQLAYLATDEATLVQDLRHNDLTPAEKDDFGQDVVHLQYTRLVGSSTTLMAQAYYNGAQGWFRILDTTTENLQQYGIDGYFVGLILGATHRKGRLGLNWGAHVNDFTRDHFMDIVGGSRQYLNTGLKNEYNTFLKASWDAGARTRLWADAQLRHARFEYRGDQPLGSVSWTFFNPKAGVRFDPSTSLSLYASVGRMAREPARSDMLDGEDNASVPYDLRAVAPEKVVDVEAGAEVRRGGLKLRADAYSMDFRDEIALTGELSEIGLPVRRNVPRSHRRGVELALDWRASPRLRLAGTAALSRNRIDEWTQYYDVYDDAGDWTDSVPIVHTDVPPLLTPEAILNGTVDWSPRPALGLSVSGRWVAASQLDNTGRPDFRTPSWFDLDGRLTLSLGSLVKRGEPRIRVQATNLLGSRKLWPSGYSYLYFVRGADGQDTFAGTAYYYPLATRSVYVTLDVRF